MSLKKSDLKLAYLDKKHARIDYNNPEIGRAHV